MTLTEIKNKLQAKFYKVGDPQEILAKEHIGIKLFRVPVMDSKEDTMWENDVLIWKDGNEYYWKNGEPKGVGYIFSTELQKYIDSKIAEGVIQYATIESTDPKQKKAIIKVVVIDSGSYKERRFLIQENAQGNFEYYSVI